jgi:predicted house-cleaning noncanonical NTP pyrophosphatase (MazG superfamily)|tara:strand:+ start:67 stop:480 length:414 start_codon:yes stop_codon:yes gene_type:complete
MYDMDDIDNHLDEVLGIVEKPKREITKVERVVPAITDDDSETDFQYARENLYNLIERGTDGLEELLEIAKQSEHPRAFEVVQQTIGQLTTTNKELLNLHKTKKDMRTEKGGPTSVNNNLFVGSTAELQKMLKGKKDG